MKKSIIAVAICAICSGSMTTSANANVVFSGPVQSLYNTIAAGHMDNDVARDVWATMNSEQQAEFKRIEHSHNMNYSFDLGNSVAPMAIPQATPQARPQKIPDAPQKVPQATPPRPQSVRFAQKVPVAPQQVPQATPPRPQSVPVAQKVPVAPQQVPQAILPPVPGSFKACSTAAT